MSWERRADNLEIKECADAYRRLLPYFWDGLSQLCISQVESAEVDKNLLEGVSSLLVLLKNPERAQKTIVKKKGKIRFFDEEGTMNVDRNNGNHLAELTFDAKKMPKSENLGDISRCAQHSNPARTVPLENLVCQLAKLCIAHIKKHSEIYLAFLATLVSSFPSRNLFTVLQEGDNEGNAEIFLEEKNEVETMASNPAVQFLNQKLLTWMKEDKADFSCLIDMLYSILHCCQNNEKMIILNHISQVSV